MDYDKYRYEQSKKEREIRKNQKVVSIKEVQLSATIEENDVLTKAKAATKFLKNGDKVKVSIRFRGRQITHQEIGLAVMQNFAERVKDCAVVERKPLVEGRHMIMILAPKDPAKEAKATKGSEKEAVKAAPAE
jgi:translation initiation factor IF-3